MCQGLPVELSIVLIHDVNADRSRSMTCDLYRVLLFAQVQTDASQNRWILTQNMLQKQPNRAASATEDKTEDEDPQMGSN